MNPTEKAISDKLAEAYQQARQELEKAIQDGLTEAFQQLQDSVTVAEYATRLAHLRTWAKAIQEAVNEQWADVQWPGGRPDARTVVASIQRAIIEAMAPQDSGKQ